MPGIDHKQLPFLISAERRFSYRQLDSVVQQLRRAAAEHQPGPKRPLMLSGSLTDEAVLLIGACWHLGVPFLPIAPGSSSIPPLPNTIRPALWVDTGAEAPDGIALPSITINIDVSESTGKTSSLFSTRTISDSQPFAYLFTSGTTGAPKLVPLKRRQMIAAADASARQFRPDPGGCWLLCLPLHHIGGISVVLRSLLYGSAVYRTHGFDEAVIKQLFSEETDLQAASLVPTMLKRLLDDPGFSAHDQLRAVLLGGGPASPELVDRARRRGLPVVTSYGMTETCAQIASNTLFDENHPPETSVGKMFQPNEIEIRDEQGRERQDGGSGTIWLRGPQVFDGYAGPPAREPFDEDGWFNTGDLGRLDENGNLYIETRRSDLIISGGENIRPSEVEEALNRLAEIAEAAVAGLPDEEWGQITAAFVVFHPDRALTLEDIREALRSRLDGYKLPRRLIKLDKLPRNDLGKIDRKKLIESSRPGNRG